MQLSMSDLRELIGGTTSAPVAPSQPISYGWRIVVLQRGWIVVGMVVQQGDEITVSNASVIRNWGTSKGLGQLALEGPQPGTKLDPCGTVKAHIAAVVLQMESEGAKWQK